jgi:CubicO group peptidase (beta-lactamase class C family)
MRVWLYRAGATLIVTLLVTGWLQREALARLHATTTLFSENRIVANFSAMETVFETVPIPVSGTAVPLPDGPAMAPPPGWQDWLARRAVTGIVVLHDGAVVHESYRLGTGRDDRRVSWSLAKSYMSALFGVALERGAIAGLDDPVTRYAPDLAGGAYDGATIRDVLEMESGVVFDEDYLDFWSDVNRMGRILALGGSMDGFAAGLTETDMAPGTRWRYVSIDTHVLGMVLRGATGRSIPALLGEHVLTPLGTRGAPLYLADGDGTAFVLGGLLLRTRDYARMGEMVRRDGAFGGRQIVPAGWLRESTAPQARTEPGAWRYGYQWWIEDDAPQGEVMARGIYGQYLYIHKDAGVVVAVNGADRGFRTPGAHADALAMLRRIAAGYQEE